MKEENELGTSEKKTKFVKAYEIFYTQNKGKSTGKTKWGEEDDSIIDPKISEEGRANTIHFSKNMG